MSANDGVEGLHLTGAHWWETQRTENEVRFPPPDPKRWRDEAIDLVPGDVPEIVALACANGAQWVVRYGRLRWQRREEDAANTAQGQAGFVDQICRN